MARELLVYSRVTHEDRPYERENLVAALERILTALADADPQQAPTLALGAVYRVFPPQTSEIIEKAS
jgi:hypothetical protein